jgi:threonine/homoserine/homoserine lactone efflux protein
VIDLLPGAGAALVFATAVLVLNATPGVDLLLTVSRTLQGGARAGFAAALGINVGCIVHALAAAFGLAAMLAVHPEGFRIIQGLGAAYLAWLGASLLRHAFRTPAEERSAGAGTAPARSFAADVRTGLLTNLLNPKVALFFLAFLPQFVPATSPHKTLSFLLLGAWFVVQSVVFLGLVVLLANRLRRVDASALIGRALKAAGGVLFLALALRLVRERPLELA